ncbi:diguanylate cyclase (GGDEF)-like protein [Sporosarcina luteola]|nr:diguanylate cyclase (GGDEF)-like protein [Sporosarcina luteola]
MKYLILSVALMSVILTLISSIYSGYRVSKHSLIESTLATNQAYADKLANSTETYLTMTLQILKTSAERLSPLILESGNEDVLAGEADRLKKQTDTFNSVLIVNKEAEILATSPQTLGLKGKKFASVGGKEALEKRDAFISQPYISLTGRLVIFISQPIFDEKGRYLGLVGGTIYLKEENILQTVLGEHFYKDGSYVYVVDQSGRIIYHPDPKRVNEVIDDNKVIQELMAGFSGAMEVTNSQDKVMLAGYATIPTAKWGVVSQKEKKSAVEPSVSMTNEMIGKTLPFLLVVLILLFLISKQIALPLQKLAHYTESSTENSQEEKINKVQTWYYEASQLKKALNYSLNFFQDRVNFFIHQSTTDPLTKVWNRRTMDEYMKKWTEQETPYAMIILDIDKFKRVNDTYGHATGDEVLKFLAYEMKAVSREQDRCCRFGGEEFVILLPGTDAAGAYRVAERLRKKMESAVSPCGEIVTISSGVAAFPEHALHPAELLELADQSLYEAKRSGRNRTIVQGKQSE